MKISVLTLGCKVNQAESSMIESALKSGGHEIVPISERPDVCIINTCTVTSKSDYQSRQMIRRAARAGARLIVTGCYSELNSEFVRSMEGVGDVVKNSHKLDIVDKLAESPVSNALFFAGQKRSRLFIKVQDGCNYHCTYCTIPRARGRSRSISVTEVLDAINNAVTSGYNEIVLTGIHLGTYGDDLRPKVTLSCLVSTILKETKISRIRLSSLEVMEINEGLIDLLSEPRLCAHLHVPLQSGDDRILKLMNRIYDRNEFSLKIKQIADRLPGISLGTDIIVGFPGETGAEFINTYKLLEELPFSYFHIFPYSARYGTPASRMPGTISSAEKKDRVKVLEILNKKKKLDYAACQVGKVLDVLLEDVGEADTASGMSGNYLKVYLPAAGLVRGSIVKARVESASEGKLLGMPVKSHNCLI